MKPQQNGFHRNRISLTARQKIVNRGNFVVQIERSAGGHKELRRAEIAQHLKLPVIIPHLVTSQAVSHLLAAIGEQRMRQFVSD
jgi:hypothetical protein